MRKIVFCFAFICFFAMYSHSQTKTYKGNYCGKLIGMKAGDFGFRVGPMVRTFFMNFNQSAGNAKMIRFNIDKVKVGDEFIIKGDPDGIISITGTGKRRRIEPCTVE